jgi:hypothetical protein
VDASGQIYQHGKVGTTRWELDGWMKTLHLACLHCQHGNCGGARPGFAKDPTHGVKDRLNQRRHGRNAQKKHRLDRDSFPCGVISTRSRAWAATKSGCIAGS